MAGSRILFICPLDPDLPSLWRTEENIKKIGSKAGPVIDVELIGDLVGTWKKFIRVRVEDNIANPLFPGIFLPKQKRLMDRSKI